VTGREVRGHIVSAFPTIMPDVALSTRYDPSAIEASWYARWRERGLFHPAPGSDGATYTIVIPPPNVTGVLHMGHALNETIQDVIVRRERMRGKRALYLPGTDHAGIATQNVVERELAQEGVMRQDVGRQAFVERVWAWVEKYGDEIYDQMAQLGISADWERARFTLEPDLSRAVREVFVRLYEGGMIYRGPYIVNWCPRCGTALSDEEVEKREQKGRLWYVRYPLAEGGGHLVIATTRPETILGDTGIAVHPDDERYRNLVGRAAMLPLVGRRLPIVADEIVDPEFGTGVVKVTPAHDADDFWIGERHGLERVVVMNPDATMNDNAGDFAGLDRFVARDAIVAALETQGLLERSDGHDHAVGRCYRCGTVVEPYLSDQWFVRMAPLAVPALAASRRGELRFTPERWQRVYENWLENVRDWCISRQIWWGHRIPVWTCANDHEFAAREDPTACRVCGSSDLEQDPDVLDTWFSSWLWPFSSLGWPDDTDDLRTFYPTQTLVTASEILFFWVARMVMAGYYCTEQKPFDDVVIHGTVRDAIGRRMSKSLGNGIDPRDVIELYGADALRYTLITAVPTGTDLKLAPDDFKIGRNFANKLWNAARFVLMNLPPGFELSEVPPSRPELMEHWILHRLDETTREVDRAMASFRLHESAHAIYGFLWHDYCDWAIEWAKAHLDGPRRHEVRSVLLVVLERGLRLLHPIMPFVTEELWQQLPDELRESESIAVAPWPLPEVWAWEEEARAFALLQAIVSSARTLRAEYGTPPARKVPLFVMASDPSRRVAIERHAEDVARLAHASALEVGVDAAAGEGWARHVVEGGLEIAIRLADLVDVEKELARLAEEAARAESLLAAARARLTDERFVTRAPSDVVERERAKAADLEQTLERLATLRSGLGG
jgi:valyl-tRNA synthetase